MTALSSSSDRNRVTLFAGTQQYSYYNINTLGEHVKRLPFSIKILLENLLRRQDGDIVTINDIQSLANWQPNSNKRDEIAFMPARVLMQDFTGVPAVVDLAAMRDAMQALGGDPNRINPLQASELVIDHSIQVDAFANINAASHNAALEATRNRERYSFLKWGQQAFDNFKVVPPDQGIVHQINLERLARVVFIDNDGLAYPDTLVGTDSHTTMINGLGVLGWGVGGIEAEAAMLGQPISMLAPQVVGFELTGHLPEGATTTDLVLTIVEMLRAHGVVAKFVEFFGDGLAYLPLADRATIANMAPEYGATCGYFPIDEETLNFLLLTGRDEEQITLVRAYAKAQGLLREPGMDAAIYSEYVSLDMSKIVPCIAGPKRPQDRIPLSQAANALQGSLEQLADQGIKSKGSATISIADHDMDIKDGSVVIASITSCTNTSNPSVMLAAGLLAKKAAARGLKVKPWVKTSLAPGSQVVTRYLEHAKLRQPLETLGFHVVGYGCATCIGNSGPLPVAVADAIAKNNLSVCSVLSGNRNFEGRIHASIRLNYLASPPLVVAYALAGSMDIDWHEDAIGNDNNGKPVYLRDIWPTRREVQQVVSSALGRDQFLAAYKDIFTGDNRWQALQAPIGQLYAWDNDSTYVQNPPYFQNMRAKADAITAISGARVLAKLGDSVTTDHISPAGAIKADSPAGVYLQEHGVDVADFNSYGSRRGNHEVMMRGTFANIRLRNLLLPDSEGNISVHIPSGEQDSIFAIAMRYHAENISCILLAGKEYGCGSSRDWAAKGPCLLGVRAVIAESYERIHRSNLIGMGILPLQYADDDNAANLQLDGFESYDIAAPSSDSEELCVTATSDNGDIMQFTVQVRIDTPKEFEYYQNGGILQYVLRQLLDQ